MPISFHLNGNPVEPDVPPGRPLSQVLRDDLHLFGTKVGCGLGQCGACAVLVNGRAFNSCILRVAKVQGSRVTTLEGLQGDPIYERLASAFIEVGAIQCGYCTPGFLVAAYGLLLQIPAPSEAEIKTQLEGHLCRCTGYRKILQAVRAAAMGEVPQQTFIPGEYIGQRVPRIDAWAKARGQARYGADLSLPGMLHAVFVRSPYPHARVVHIDTTRARQVTGVRSVLTGHDIPGHNLIGEIIKDTPVLATEKVRFIGDPVAVVAGDSPEAARAGAAAVQVEYERLPAVFDPLVALQAHAPHVHEQGNLMGSFEVRKGDPERAFEQADVVVEGEYRTPHIEHAYLEPEAGTAYIDEQGVLTVLASCQYPHSIHAELTRVTGLPWEQTRVRQASIGGAFGGKVDVTVHMAIALLALATGQPVRMVFSRPESMLTTVKRHPFLIRQRLAANREGKILAADIEIVDDTGAYALAGPIVIKRVATHAAGAYEIPNVRCSVKAVYTNNVPSGAMRGFGLPQAFFATECQVDRLAELLGLHPIELRARNILRDGSLTHTSQRVSAAGLDRCLTLIRAVYHQRRQELPELPLQPRRRRGLGVAVMHYGLGYSGIANPAMARCILDQTGTLVVKIGLVDVGQGSSTVFAQMAAATMGVHIDRLRLVTEDTWETDDPGPTSASRDTYFGGNAIASAVSELKTQLLSRVAEPLAVDPARLALHEDAIWLEDERLLGFDEACAVYIQDHALEAHGVFDPVIFLDEHGQGDPYPIYSYAAQLAEVEVDLDTGEVTLVKLWAAHDSGRIINPSGAEGQVEGGAVMALGNSLLEELVIKDGIVLNADLAGYVIPSIQDTPEIETMFVDNQDPSGPFGAKGIGECSLLPTAPAIANAVHDAIGCRVSKLPIKAQAVLAWLHRNGGHEEPGI